MANLATNVPLVNEAFVDPQTGKITEAWFIFLIQLWRRTGGGGGITPSTLTIDDVFAIEQTTAHAAVPGAVDFLSVLDTFARPVIGPDSLAGETIFGSPGPKDSLSEMVFAQPSFSASTTDFGASMLAWFNSLPTTLPGSPGVLWNNGGTLSQS